MKMIDLFFLIGRNTSSIFETVTFMIVFFIEELKET